MMTRRALIEKLTDIQRTVEQLLTQLQASEHDAFAAHVGDTAQFASEPEKAESRLSVAFRVAESNGFKGDFRQWEHLLRIGD